MAARPASQPLLISTSDNTMLIQLHKPTDTIQGHKN